MQYEVKLKSSVKKQLKNIDKKQVDRILVKIYLLSKNPFPKGVGHLTGRKAYRIRIGDYRVIYEVHNKQLLIQVIRVGHRRDVYRT
ncbi:MAG: type II toxin-antitoxin system RelE/ParE family toxin [Candidatus Saccharibacteria bacterium]